MTLMQTVNDKGNCERVGGDGVYGNFPYFVHFFCKPKTALRNKVYSIIILQKIMGKCKGQTGESGRGQK